MVLSGRARVRGERRSNWRHKTMSFVRVTQLPVRNKRLCFCLFSLKQSAIRVWGRPRCVAYKALCIYRLASVKTPAGMIGRVRQELINSMPAVRATIWIRNSMCASRGDAA